MASKSNKDDHGALQKGLSWAVQVDREAVEARVAAARRKKPTASKAELARAIYAAAAWKATASGAATGLVANPVAAVPAAVVDGAAVLRLQVEAAAAVAVIYEAYFLKDPDAIWELRVPLFGASAASQVLRQMGQRGAQQLTRQVIRRYLSKETLKAVKRVMLKHFGLRVTQRAVITKTLPLVGALVGGTWNHAEVRLTGNRVIACFEGRTI